MFRMATIILTTVLLSTATARTWHVPADVAHVAAAADSAQAGDIIEVAPGTHAVANVHVPGAVTIRGGADSGVVFDGAGAGGIVSLDAASSGARLEDITFTNVTAAAISISQASDVVIDGCRFTSITPHASQTAAIFLEYVDDSIIIRDCVFTDIVLDNGSIVTTSTNAHPRIEGCLFFGNRWSGVAGGIIHAGYNSATGVLVDRCTITRNSGPSLFMANFGVIRLQRSIVAGNEVTDMLQVMANEGFLDVDCSDFPAGHWSLVVRPGEGVFAADPCFCDPDADDFHLSADSPCRAGQPWGCGEQVGALGQGCGELGCDDLVATEVQSWSAIKQMFR